MRLIVVAEVIADTLTQNMRGILCLKLYTILIFIIHGDSKVVLFAGMAAIQTTYLLSLSRAISV